MLFPEGFPKHILTKQTKFLYLPNVINFRKQIYLFSDSSYFQNMCIKFHHLYLLLKIYIQGKIKGYLLDSNGGLGKSEG